MDALAESLAAAARDRVRPFFDDADAFAGLAVPNFRASGNRVLQLLDDDYAHVYFAHAKCMHGVVARLAVCDCEDMAHTRRALADCTFDHEVGPELQARVRKRLCTHARAAQRLAEPEIGRAYV